MRLCWKKRKSQLDTFPNLVVIKASRLSSSHLHPQQKKKRTWPTEESDCDVFWISILVNIGLSDRYHRIINTKTWRLRQLSQIRKFEMCLHNLITFWKRCNLPALRCFVSTTSILMSPSHYIGPDFQSQPSRSSRSRHVQTSDSTMTKHGRWFLGNGTLTASSSSWSTWINSAALAATCRHY